MTAMGLGGGGGGGGGGDHALEGITQPPKGKVSGPVTPDVSKQLNDKKQVMAKGGGGGSPSSGAAPVGAAGAGASGASSGSAGGGGASRAEGGQPQQAPAKSEAPKSPSGGGTRGSTAGAAAHGDGAGSVEAMIEELEHGHDSGARVRAAEALGKVKSPKAKPVLEKAARDRDPTVAAAAAKALKHLT